MYCQISEHTLICFTFCWLHTLESEIDIGQGINVVPGEFGKNNRQRALNKPRINVGHQRF